MFGLKNKKFLCFLLSLFSIVCSAAIFAACSDKPKEETYYLYKNGGYDKACFIVLADGKWRDDGDLSGIYTLSSDVITLYLDKTEEYAGGSLIDGVLTIVVGGDKMVFCKEGKTPQYTDSNPEAPDSAEIKSLKFELSLDRSYYIVTDIWYQSTDIVIPSVYKGLPVREVSRFDDNIINLNWIKSIVIPDSIVNFDSYIFEECDELEYNISDNLKYLGNPDNPYLVLAGYTGEITNAVINPGCKVIASFAFNGCSTLERVVIPDGVKCISYAVFYNCSSLTEVIIPDSVSDIKYSAFEGCDNLMYNIKNNLKYLGNADNPYLVLASADKDIESADIDGRCKIIAGNSFIGCTNLVSVNIPEGVMYICEHAFSFCESLQEVVIPRSVKSIGDSAFSICVNLSDITLSAGVRTIGEYAFYCCALRNITLPEGIIGIGGAAFIQNKMLQEITIPRSVRFFGMSAFNCCDRLTDVYFVGNVHDWCQILFANTDSNPLFAAKNFYLENRLVSLQLIIPSTVTEIKNNAFCGLDTINNLTVEDSVTSIGEGAFFHCRNLQTVRLGNGVQYMGRSAFEQCFKLNKVDLGIGLKNIGAEAFELCEKLNEFVLPESVVEIGESAFSFCSSLHSVTLSESLTDIGESAFYGCDSLTSITLPKKLTDIGDDAFADCSNLLEVINFSELPIQAGSQTYGKVGYYAQKIITPNS